MGNELIMVIDDDAGLRAVLADLLRDEGYRVVAVVDGSEGLALLSAGERPDLILLHSMTPVDGWRFRAEQMMNPALASIPSIVVTAVPAHRGRPDLGEIARTPLDARALLSMIRRRCARDVQMNAGTKAIPAAVNFIANRRTC